MMTRAEYMTRNGIAADTFALHCEYQSQFVTPATVARVVAVFGLDRLREALAGDRHLNRLISLDQWDALGRPPMNEEALEAAGEIGFRNSRGVWVCVWKEAARQAVEKDAGGLWHVQGTDSPDRGGDGLSFGALVVASSAEEAGAIATAARTRLGYTGVKVENVTPPGSQAPSAPFPRIVHAATRTYWEVAPGVFNATESADTPPTNTAGYRDLAALCRLKGDATPTADALA